MAVNDPISDMVSRIRNALANKAKSVDCLNSRVCRGIADVGERRAAVYKTLVAAANTSQADLRAYLDARQIPYSPYYLVNGMEVRGDALLRTRQMEQRAHPHRQKE